MKGDIDDSLRPHRNVIEGEVRGNPFKDTGLRTIRIGDPQSASSQKWLYVTAEQDVLCHGPAGVQSTTVVHHKFRVQHYDEILPTLLDRAAKFKSVEKMTS